jgi:hypothetical protein
MQQNPARWYYSCARATRLAWGENAQFFCSGYRVPTPIHPEFAVDVGCMAPDRLVRYIQDFSDLFVARRPSQQLQYLELSRG